MTKRLKSIPRCERKTSRQRLFSTNFEENMKNSGIKCWVPWEDYKLLRDKYKKLVARSIREFKRK